MAEIVADYMEDWSLQAIVRGSSCDLAKVVVDMDMDGQDSCHHVHDHHQFDRDFLANFPEFFEVSAGSGDELEDLYKPFYQVNHSLPAQSTVLEFQQHPCQQMNVVDEAKPSDQSSGNSCVARATAGYTPKYKRRKNQQKRVVTQVSAEGLTSDKWAWRKYGQKPIKGSPYPRSYYRCSSLKGCLARKQVEQSCTDPGMFIITYTAEHSHSQPTRRNSLAGTVRQKFPSYNNKSPNSSSANKTATIIKQEKANEEFSSSSGSSSKTLKQDDGVDDVPNQARMIKKENYCIVENEAGIAGEGHDDNIMSDFVFNEDFFAGLEDFNEFVGEMPSCSTLASTQQFSVRSCSSFSEITN